MTRNRHIQLLTIEYAANARGVVKTHSYEQVRGLLLGTTYSDGTTARAYSYNHLGLMTQVVDDAGSRTIGYNAYNEQATDSLLAGGKTHLVTELRDDYGRSSGYTYANNGSVQQTVSIGYGTDGRISSAGFLHGGAAKNFGYTYLAGTNLLQVLSKPNGMMLTQTYEATRDLLTGMAYHRGSTLVAQREYTYSTADTSGMASFTPPSPTSAGELLATKSEATTSSGFLPSAGASKACPLLPMGLFFKGRQWESKAFFRCKALMNKLL